VWAVGQIYRGGAFTRPHWDGAEWSSIRSPAVGDTSFLNAVVAISPTDVWAAGVAYDDIGLPVPLFQHWDGHAWHLVPGPATNGYIRGLAAVSSTDAWAVGIHTLEQGSGSLLINHWDGVSWTEVAIDPLGDSSTFWDAAATASDDVWAVGDYYDGTAWHTLSEHWDGARWTITSTPDGGQSPRLNGVAALPGQQMAVGYFDEGELQTQQPLAEHRCEVVRGER
jgi:hypothetical protein